jgi:hypothetical protein
MKLIAELPKGYRLASVSDLFRLLDPEGGIMLIYGRQFIVKCGEMYSASRITGSNTCIPMLHSDIKAGWVYVVAIECDEL